MFIFRNIIIKKNKIDIFYKENFAIAIFNSAFFPLSLLVFSFGVEVFKNIWNNNKEGFIILYFCSFIFISLSYIVGYIKRTIYAFISPENKLSSLEFKKTYEKININKM